MSGDLVQHEDDRDDLTISYMLGFERGKDATAIALTLAQARIRELEEAIWLAHDHLNTYRSAAVEEVIDKLETYIPGLSGKEAPNV
jgi:hypothetical protein